MSNSSQLPNFSLRKRSSGLAEIGVLLDLLPDPVLVIDPRGKRILQINSKATQLTAYTRAELAQMEIRQLFPDFSENLLAEKMDSAPLTLVKRNKTELEVQLTFTDLNTQGKWVLVTIIEMTRLKQREVDRLRQSQLLDCLHGLALAPHQTNLELSLNFAVQAGISLTGATSLFIYQADGQSLELRPVAAWGGDLPDRLPSEDLSHLRTPHLWTPGKRTLSVLHRAARGAQLTFVATAPIGQPNALIGLVAVASKYASAGEDLLPLVQIFAGTITTIIQHHTLSFNLQKRITDQLRSMRMYEAAEAAIQDGVIVLSPDLTVLRMNRAAESTLGYTNLEVRGQPIENILIGPDSLNQDLQNAHRGIPAISQENSRLYRRSGQAFLAQVSLLPVIANRELSGIVILIQDLSEKEQIQVHAQQLEQRALLGEVTAVFAHEVRNPMNNISTGLQLMALNLPPDDPNQEQIGRLQQDCDRLAELMKSVLSFSHPTEYEMEAVDIGLLIERMVERTRPRMTRANVKHHLQIEPSLPPVRGNPRALEQVFTNLITNAIQAMDGKGGTLALKLQSVKAAGQRQYVEVSVADSGPGIPKELLDRIFQPFFTTKKNGTGLGLAITKRIITAHKGTLRVNSFPGGTVFQVQLPEADPPVSAEVAVPEIISVSGERTI